MRCFLPLAAVLVVTVTAPACHAGDHEQDHRILFFSGGDISHISSFSWVGADAALLDKRSVSGPVLRIGGGVGRYTYKTEEVEDGEVAGLVTQGEAMLGWRWVRPGLTLTALAGPQVVNHILSEDDPNNHDEGTHLGAVFAGDLWWEPRPDMVVAAAGNYGTARHTYYARVFGGMRPWSWLLAGPELVAFGNRQSDQQRLGLSVSANVTGTLCLKLSGGGLHGNGNRTGVYGTFGVDRLW